MDGAAVPVVTLEAALSTERAHVAKLEAALDASVLTADSGADAIQAEVHRLEALLGTHKKVAVDEGASAADAGTGSAQGGETDGGDCDGSIIAVVDGGEEAKHISRSTYVLVIM